jgi:hypothetical protein
MPEFNVSEVEILTALILKHARASVKDRFGDAIMYRPTDATAQAAAKAILACGFSMNERPVDDEQNERLASIEKQVTAIYGWTGLPKGL